MSTPRGINLPGITWRAEPPEGVKKYIGVPDVSRNGLKGVPWHWTNHRYKVVNVRWSRDQTRRSVFDGATAYRDHHQDSEDQAQCPSGHVQRPNFSDVTANWNSHRRLEDKVRCPHRPEFGDVTANWNNHRHTEVKAQCPRDQTQRRDFGDGTANSNNHKHTEVKVQFSTDQTQPPGFNDAHADCYSHKCRVAKLKWSRDHRPIQAKITWVPKVGTIKKANIVWSNHNTVSVGKKIQISWLPTQVPNPKRHMHITWAPTSATCKRVNVTWKEQEPKASRKPLITWAQEPVTCRRKVANINWIVETKCQTPEVDCLK